MPAPPPPPAPPSCGAPSAPGDDRGQLLRSIRAGATLRKTVTVDKSAPAITGRVRDDRGNGGSAPSSGAAPPRSGAPNLGGLFSGGMPKLKATGLRANPAEKESAAVKRGPPPVPPPAAHKPSSDASPEQPHAPKSFGKPTLAPKPPPVGHATQKPSPPPKKLNLAGGAPSVSRAQSMRIARSPPVLAHATLSSLHQSQDCLNESAQHRQLAMNRALRPPVARPPSPPTSRTPREAPTPLQTGAPPATRIAPPPPPPPPPSRLAVTAPSMPPPPPPPPYRSTSMHQRLAPPPPPTPPTRVASANAPTLQRNGALTLANLDLEARFADKFHSISNFPSPAPFRGVPKVYSSKNAAKQQAPGPPPSSAPGTMLRSNDSSGGKQWRCDAPASSPLAS